MSILGARLFASVLITVVLFAALGTSFAAMANGEHDAPTASAGAPLPRFAATSELFEVVGIVERKQLGVYIDRFATNEPVTKSTLELQIGTNKFIGTLRPEQGDFTFANATFEKPGDYAMLLTITTGEDIDILAANLLIPAPAEADAPVWLSAHTARNAAIGAALLAALIGVAVLVRWRLNASSRSRATHGVHHV